jgi:hypothetical protein
MYSEPVCQVTRSWVDVGSFHTRLFGSCISLSPQSGNFWVHPRISQYMELLKTGKVQELRSDVYSLRRSFPFHRYHRCSTVENYIGSVNLSANWRTSDQVFETRSVFPPIPPHVPYGLRGLPSRLWPKCNRLLRLWHPWGAVTLSRWGGWWYMNMKYQEAP